jgi:hypothetical protein
MYLMLSVIITDVEFMSGFAERRWMSKKKDSTLEDRRDILSPRLVLGYRTIESGAQDHGQNASLRLESSRPFAYICIYFIGQASTYDSDALFENPLINASNSLCM